jgi:hypothetical protein
VSDNQPIVRADAPSREAHRRAGDLRAIEADHDAVRHQGSFLVEVAARSRARIQLPKADLIAASGGIPRRLLWSRTRR